ncbi:hypothetical protein MUK42_14085 [Musa troglodytarum]|uniref:Uncharacterized protein n=1 Tax=Musa troglodytarum TaxID=320322 RepID=A0A9E7KLW9_9LILI|nr:hypothetical protein MUK42_14085 [Musa troglodytarum]
MKRLVICFAEELRMNDPLKSDSFRKLTEIFKCRVDIIKVSDPYKPVMGNDCTRGPHSGNLVKGHDDGWSPMFDNAVTSCLEFDAHRMYVKMENTPPEVQTM